MLEGGIHPLAFFAPGSILRYILLFKLQERNRQSWHFARLAQTSNIQYAQPQQLRSTWLKGEVEEDRWIDGNESRRIGERKDKV